MIKKHFLLTLSLVIGFSLFGIQAQAATYIKVLSLNNNEVLKPDAPYEIKWESSEVNSIGIVLYKGGTVAGVIARDIPTTYTKVIWTPGFSLEEREDYKIGVYKYPWATGNPVDYSDNSFSIKKEEADQQTLECQSNPYKDFEPYNEPPINLQNYADFVKAVAQRYNGQNVPNPANPSEYLRVNTFSLWNEPNLPDFWKGSASNFVTMNNLAYDALKNVRPDVTVWGPNLLGSCCDPEGFLQQTGGALKFDVFAVHAYPANFNAEPSDASNKIGFAIGNLETIFSALDQYPSYAKKPVALTEIGYRSNWENQFGVTDVWISETTKSQYLKESLSLINLTNEAHGRITAVANNVLYNPWRWWSSGLINYFDSSANSITFANKIPAFYDFKNWQLVLYPVPTENVDAAYFDWNDNYTVIKGNRYWYKSINGEQWSDWYTNTLQSAYYRPGDNAVEKGVPTSGIDTAYWDHKGGYTVVKGDRYWYRIPNTDTWWTDTLYNAYYNKSNNNAQQLGVPTSDIDAAHFDSSGGYTVIKGDRYWYRSSEDGAWYTNTLRSAYYTSSNAAQVNIPTENIDAAYVGFHGGYTVVKGNRYWYRKTDIDDWWTDTLEGAYYPNSTKPQNYGKGVIYYTENYIRDFSGNFSKYNLPVPDSKVNEFSSYFIPGSECSRYLDLTNRELNYFSELGLDFVIVGFGPASWYNVAPIKPINPTNWQDPAYNFQKLDEWIGKLQGQGITPVLQLWGTPTWASGKSSPKQ